MKYAIIVLAVIVVMHDISIRRLNRKFGILHSFFDTTIRQLEEYASKQTEKEFTAYDSAKISHDCIGLCDIKKKLNREDETIERQRLEGKRWTDALTIEEKKQLLDGWIVDEPQAERRE